ncbi:ferritin family protein [Chloroflexota bacterium]
MTDELVDLFDKAIYKEIAAEATYIAGQKMTQNPAAMALMKELALEEHKHAEVLRDMKEKGPKYYKWHNAKVPDLKISQYLVSGDSLEKVNLQDALIFAIKREQQAVEFYSNMIGIPTDASAKRIAHRIADEELKHKLKLEILYDDIFYKED